MESKIMLLLRSRKFWTAVIGLAVILLKAFAPGFPLTEEQITPLVILLVGYIFGTAIEDGLTRR